MKYVKGRCGLTVLIMTLVFNGLFVSNQIYGQAISSPSSWAVESIETVEGLGILRMDELGLYHEPITREGYGHILYQLYEYYHQEPVAATIDWSLPIEILDSDNIELYALKGLGLMLGYPDDNFKPEQPITRAEIMTLYMRLLDGLGIEMTSADISKYEDWNQIPSYAIEAVESCVGSGLIQGRTNSRLDPLGLATVEESMVIVARIFNMLGYPETRNAQIYDEGYVVSDMDYVYQCRFNLSGQVEAIEAYDDYTFLGLIYKGGIMSPLRLYEGQLYFETLEGIWSRYDPVLGRIFEGVLAPDGVAEQRITPIEGLLIVDGVMIAADVVEAYILGEHIVWLDENDCINVYDGTGSGNKKVYEGNQLQIYLSGNHLMISEKIDNDLTYTHFIPVYMISNFLYYDN